MSTTPDMQRLLTEALEKAGVSVERIRLDEAGSGGGKSRHHGEPGGRAQSA